MRRDMDLIRNLLFVVRDLSPGSDFKTPEYEAFSRDEVREHLYLLHQAGFIEASVDSVLANSVPYIDPIRLTWEGHEFVEAIQDSSRWERLKKHMAKMGGFAISVAKPLAIEWMKQEAGLS